MICAVLPDFLVWLPSGMSKQGNLGLEEIQSPAADLLVKYLLLMNLLEVTAARVCPCGSKVYGLKCSQIQRMTSVLLSAKTVLVLAVIEHEFFYLEKLEFSELGSE